MIVMRKVYLYCFCLLAFVVASVSTAYANQATSTNYSLYTSVIPAGGAEYSSANYTQPFALGQISPVQDFPASTNYRLAGGFYAAVAAYQPPVGNLEFTQTNFNVNEDAGSATITVSRVDGGAGAISVDWQTADNTATAGSDYTTGSGTLNWANGDTADKTFTVSVTTDSDIEGNELIDLSLSNSTGGAALGTQNTTTLTIIDVVPAGNIEFASATQTIAENGTSITVNVNRVNGNNGAVAVDFATADVTATAGSDYVTNSGTLNWADTDNTAKTITINISDDTTYEGAVDETFSITLSNPTGGSTLGAQTTLTVTIQEDDPAPQNGVLQFTTSSDSVAENAGSITVNVERVSGSDGAVSVQYATSTGSANNSDFTATSGTLNWANGDSNNQSFNVSINDDSNYESNESFTVALSSPTGGATLGTSSMTITIQNDDSQPPPPPPPVQRGVLQLSAATYTVSENAGTLDVSVVRNSGSDGTVSVQLATADDTASAGSDYTAQTVTLTFNNGETLKNASIPILDDTQVENTESFSVNLSNVSGGATLGTQQTATVTLNDDDVASISGVLQLSDAIYLVDENGGTVTVNVERVNGSVGNISISLRTEDATAIAGSDYTAQNVVLDFAHSETLKTVSIPIIDDTVVEGATNETFNLVLHNPSLGASVGGQSNAVVSIRDNDVCQAGVVQFTTGIHLIGEDAGQLDINVERSGGQCGEVSVDYATTAGSAQADDFVAAQGNLVWANGQAGTQTFAITITDDTLFEGSSPEIFKVTLSSPSNGVLLGSQTTTQVQIQDNDVQVVTPPSPVSPPPTDTSTPTVEQHGTLQFTQANENGAEGETVTLSVSRLDGSDGDVAVQYEVIDINTTLNEDYSGAASGVLTWTDGDSSTQTLSVSLLDDTLFEATETFIVLLSQASGGAELGAVQSVMVTITDDDKHQIADALYCEVDSCGYTLMPSSVNHNMDAAAGQFEVATGTGCSWQASSNADWLQLQTSSHAQGEQVTYLVTANDSGAEREASVTVACATVTVTQAHEAVEPEEQDCGMLDTTGALLDDETCEAKFVITASRDGGLTFANTFRLHDRVEVEAEITLPPHHVGQVGELVALVLHDGQPWRKVPHLWAPASFDNIPAMTAFTGPKILAETEAFQVIDGLIGVAGVFEVFVGYRLDDGTVVFNPNALVIGVKPSLLPLPETDVIWNWINE